MQSIKAYFLPSLAPPDDLASAAVVVIDVLRATTVIAHALAAGAREVIPCLEVEDAVRAAESLPLEQAVLGGERGGLKIDGFNLGNSPQEYNLKSVGGKTVVFTTTNGTKAMQHCHAARRVLLGAFVNASAVVAAVRAEQKLRIVCAGTRGEVTREDVLFAGFVADRLLNQAEAVESNFEVNDQLLIARGAWQAVVNGISGVDVAGGLAAALRSTQGGRNLKSIGLAHDIDEAAQIDRFGLVGQLDLHTWRITAMARVSYGHAPVG